MGVLFQKEWIGIGACCKGDIKSETYGMQKNDTDDLIRKAEVELQTQRKKRMDTKGVKGGWDELGD